MYRKSYWPNRRWPNRQRTRMSATDRAYYRGLKAGRRRSSYRRGTNGRRFTRRYTVGGPRYR